MLSLQVFPFSVTVVKSFFAHSSSSFTSNFSRPMSHCLSPMLSLQVFPFSVTVVKSFFLVGSGVQGRPCSLMCALLLEPFGETQGFSGFPSSLHFGTSQNSHLTAGSTVKHHGLSLSPSGFRQ